MAVDGNILIIADTHIPFEHRDYLDHCNDTRKKYKCKQVFHIGDLVDNHAISAHVHDPDGYSPLNEHKEALKRLQFWYKAFPNCGLCIGNHDERVERAAMRHGLTRAYFKDFEDLWELPRGWDYRIQYEIYGVKIFHGMGYSGQYAHRMACIENQRSIVMGHLHANAGAWYTANDDRLIFGLAVGCGIDRKTYAFHYGRDMRRKPVIGCGVIMEGGMRGEFIPMEM